MDLATFSYGSFERPQITPVEPPRYRVGASCVFIHAQLRPVSDFNLPQLPLGHRSLPRNGTTLPVGGFVIVSIIAASFS